MSPLRRTLTRLLRVPPQPEPPAGAPGSLRVFQAARGFLSYRLAAWGLRQLGAVAGIAFVLISSSDWGFERLTAVVEHVPVRQLKDVLEFFHSFGGAFLVFEILAIGILLAQLPLGFAAARLDYEYAGI